MIWFLIIPLLWILSIIWMLLLLLLLFDIAIIETRLINTMTTTTSCSICLMKWRFFRGFFSFSYLLTLLLFSFVLVIPIRYLKEMHLPETRLLLSPFINCIGTLFLLNVLLLNWLLDKCAIFRLRYLRYRWKLRWFTVLAFIR